MPKGSTYPVATSPDAFDALGVQGGVTKKLASTLLATQAELDAHLHTGTYVRLSLVPFNVKDPPSGFTAAVGDGTTNDAPAIQAAIDSVFNTGGGVAGGTVFLPKGQYKCLSQLVVREGVALRGEGMKSTMLDFPTSLGSAVPGVDLLANEMSIAPSLQHLKVRGPGGGSLGVEGNPMYGVRLGGHCDLDHVYVQSFHSGIVFIGDHNTLNRCKSSSNYYNLLWADGAATRGNQIFLSIEADGAWFAAIAVAGGNMIDSSQFFGGTIGTAPYGIYKFGVNTHAVMSNTEMYGLSMETIGNGAILDESTGSTDSLNKVIISEMGFSWSDTLRIGARVKDYAVDVKDVTDTEIRTTTNAWTAGTLAVYNIRSGVTNTGLTLHGGPYPTFGAGGGGRGVAYLATAYRAIVLPVATTGMAIGEAVEPSGTSCSRYGTNGGRGFLGIALTAGVVGNFALVATDGRVAASCGVVPDVGIALTPDTGGVLQSTSALGSGGYPKGTTSGTVPGPYPLVAYSLNSSGSAGMRDVVLTSVGWDRQYINPGTVLALPTAGAGYRGQLLKVEGGAGVADVVSVCLKSAADTYSWKTVATG